MDEELYGFHKTDATIQDGAVAGAAAFGKGFTLWAKRYALELEDLFDVGGPNHYGKAKRQVMWLGEKIFKPGAPAFNPDMSFDEVIETYCRGHVFGGLHNHLSDLLNYHARGAENDRPFPDPWVAADRIDGYCIDPIATADALREEGFRMHHCVANFVPDVARDEAYFYHVSKNGKRAATLQLARAANGFQIEEIRGLCNRR